jgi:uncharacterized Zn-binding protein involved in type VI secretion
MRRHHITLGALTTAGGTVVSASSLGTINGAAIALEGDMISCRSCKSTGHIVCDGPRHPETWNGKAVALENDFCVCKCVPPPRLIPIQSMRYQTIDGAEVMSLSDTDGFVASVASTATLFNDKFRLIDEDNGRPLAHVEYAIVRESGEIEYGTTDEDGHTHLLSSTAKSEEVEIYV